jgi:hypothetical protein
MAADQPVNNNAEMQAASAQLIADMEALMKRARAIILEREGLLGIAKKKDPECGDV